jgi:predicted Ser/Thr protein kinase/DNA-directed RNA polymerase subunit RPC12/RpoP
VNSAEHEKRPTREPEPLDIDETAMLGEDGVTASDPRSRRRLAGDTFGRYRILKTLGEGAMGSVYLALDTQLNRRVALKIPKVDSEEDSKFIARFLREARAAATLSHPNICPVYDVGEIDNTHFITMAYVQGNPLSDFINPDKLQRDRNVAYVARRIALALHEAHINGLVHRDVKPANIMIDQRDEPIIMDFGLARHIDDAEDARLTRDGAILGSPAYMSPEQIEAKDDALGPSTDIYSLGVILYELLTGRLPYQGSVASIIGQIVSRDPTDPRKWRADVSPQLAAIALKAMSKKPVDRYASMKDFAAALADYLKSKPEESVRDKRVPERPETTKKPIPKSGTDTDAGLKLTKQPIEVTCRCGQRLRAKRELAGKRIRCPRCSGVVALPGASVAGTSTGQIDVACRQCGQRFLARLSLAGKVVRCPMCSRPLTVAKPGEVQPTVPQIEVICMCGQQFVARAHLAGKRVKCTACGRPLQIPALRAW